MIKLLNTKSLYNSLYAAIEFCKNHFNEEIEIIVPDKLALFMEKFLFEKLDIRSSFKIKVSTLNRFAKRKCLVDKDKLISEVGSILLIHNILNKNANLLQSLKSKAYSFSYSENILRTINQFKASKITWQEMENFTSNNLQLQNKILDLALVYKEYEISKSGLLDNSDFYLMSTLYVSVGLKDRNILFVGFDDFTAIEYSILERLATDNNLHVFVSFHNGKNKRIFNNEIYNQLKSICYTNNLNFLVENCNVENTNLKNFLHDNLFAFENEQFVLDNETIRVFNANGVNEEIEFVARSIKNKILSGKSFSNFGVAVFDLENKINLIKDIFSKYELNYYVDSQITLNKSVFYKFLCSLIKYNIESYNLCHLIDIISSPFFIIESQRKQLLIDYLVGVNFKGKFKNGIIVDESLKAEAEALIKFLSLFNLGNNHTAKECIEIIKNGLDKINVDEIIVNLSLNVDLQDKILLSKSKESVYNLFDEILKFNSEISIYQFLDVLLNIASVVKINNLPLTLDAIKIVDANNTMEIFTDLYLVNCTSENAPNLKYDCGIVLDSEINELNFKYKLSPTIAHINNLSILRLYNTSLLFEKNLIVTYSQKPSDLINEFVNKIQIKTKNGIFNIVSLVDNENTKYVALSENDYLEFLCKNDKNNKKITENIGKVKNFYKISENNLKIYKNLKEISASFLENYFNCPFYCFLQNMLKIKPRDSVDILPFDIGNILHEIMFKYYKLKKDVGDIYEFCRDEVFAFVNNNDRLKLNIESPILTALIDEAVRVINAVEYIDKNTDFMPTSFEYEFKGEEALKLKNINIRGKVDRVDVYNDLMRVIDYKSGKSDANLKELYYGNKLQLFLYASAMENILNKKLVGSFYMPLRNAYRTEDVNPYALKGFFINEDFVLKAMDNRFETGFKSDIIQTIMDEKGKAGRTKGVTKLEFGEMLNLKNYAQKISEQAIEEIKQGYINPTPSANKKPCTFCPYSHLCLKDSANRLLRQSNTVTSNSFKEESNV